MWNIASHWTLNHASVYYQNYLDLGGKKFLVIKLLFVYLCGIIRHRNGETRRERWKVGLWFGWRKCWQSFLFSCWTSCWAYTQFTLQISAATQLIHFFPVAQCFTKHFAFILWTFLDLISSHNHCNSMHKADIFLFCPFEFQFNWLCTWSCNKWENWKVI